MKSFNMLGCLQNEKKLSVIIPIIAVLTSLIFGAIILLFLGKNPLIAYKNLLQGSGFLPKPSYGGSQGMITDFMSFLDAWTPLLIASLAVAIALKAGLFNIGVAGQMLIGGFIATILVGYSALPLIIAKPLALIIGCVVGALAGAFIGYLKHTFNINEVVSSIMLNYIFQYTISFFIHSAYINPISRQSNPISTQSRWTIINKQIGNYKIDIPLGIIIGFILVFVLKFIMDKTILGYELRAVGLGKRASKHSGISIGTNTILAMIISGGLAGIAGIMYYMGYFGSIRPNTLSPIGFDAIAVALLGANNPIGILFSSLLISLISKGSTYMRSISGIEAEIATLIIGIILLFSACGEYIKSIIIKINTHKEA